MIHVLYVDDEPDKLESGKNYLEESGYIAADTALSAYTALEMLEQKSYDAIVSDFQLPDMEGITFLKKIRKSVPGLPFILFSDDDRPDTFGGVRNPDDIFGHKKADKNTPRFAGLRQTLLETIRQHRISEQFRHFIENASEGIIVVKDDIITYSNPALRKILGGFANEEVEGRNFTDFIHPHDREKMHMRTQKRLMGGEPEPEYTFRTLTRNGSIRCMESKGIVIEWEGQPATLIFLSDVTERKQAERALVLANRKISVLNDLTRHDIANRLTVMRGRLNRVRKITKDPQVIRHLDEADNAGRDIFNHLEMARAYQDLGMVSPRWFNLRSILDYRRILAEAPDLKMSIETGDLEIYTDPLCPRVFENLIDNSLRHGNHVSEINITTREASNGLVITLEDNGTGILDKDKERIFEQGVGKHTGLGLFLSREILSITGITIRETGSAGRCARFEITVPCGAYRPASPRQAIGLPCT
jgi:PAS domain S-box-containing protein